MLDRPIHHLVSEELRSRIAHAVLVLRATDFCILALDVRERPARRAARTHTYEDFGPMNGLDRMSIEGA